MFDGIIKWIETQVKPFEEFILTNGTNPVLWVALFLGGLLLFTIVYGALHRDG